MEKESNWTHGIGVLAWAPLPTTALTQLDIPQSSSSIPSKCDTTKTPQTHSKSKAKSKRSPKSTAAKTQNSELKVNLNMKLLWPCILYPSWARAVNKSHSHDLLSSTKELHIMGCKKPTPLKLLRKDSVPTKAALGTGFLDKGKYYRKRVVAHFLGLEVDVNFAEGMVNTKTNSKTNTKINARQSWSPVHIQDLKPYTVESCKERLKQMFRRKKGGDNDRLQYNTELRERLILAMTESSIVMEDGKFDPNLLFRQLGIGINGDKVGGDDDICKNKERDGEVDDDDDDALQNDCTPECFDDWRDAGDHTQRLNESGETQGFSQSVSSSTQGSFTMT